MRRVRWERKSFGSGIVLVRIWGRSKMGFGELLEGVCRRGVGRVLWS